MHALNLFYLNKTSYSVALAFQESLFKTAIDQKLAGEKTEDYLIFLQHTPVYTLGKSGDIKNLKVNVEEIGAEYFETNRGGDITYHGPGQLTVYPIFNLDNFAIGVRKYVETLEQCVIACMKEFGIECGPIKGASGVWVEPNTDQARKICAVGIKVSHGICMHGLALNINTDLKYFDNIVPCGIEDKGVTSMEKELGEKLDFNKVAELLYENFNKYFPKK